MTFFHIQPAAATTTNGNVKKASTIIANNMYHCFTHTHTNYDDIVCEKSIMKMDGYENVITQK